MSSTTHRSRSDTASSTQPGVGAQLRAWRERRRRSQMDLALDVGLSARHLSFIETGRAQPSAAMLLALAEGLGVPLRERNRLLLAAGFAPRFAEPALAATELEAVRHALQRLLDAHQPYPGIVLDREWNVVQGNRAAMGLVALMPAALTTPVLNVFRAGLHPEGLAASTVNFAQWGAYLLGHLHRLVANSGDAGLAAIEQEVLAYPNVQALMQAGGPSPLETADALLVPCVLQLPVGQVSMFTTLTTFGTPRNVTLDELCVELFYPSDAESEALLRALARV